MPSFHTITKLNVDAVNRSRLERLNNNCTFGRDQLAFSFDDFVDLCPVRPGDERNDQPDNRVQRPSRPTGDFTVFDFNRVRLKFSNRSFVFCARASRVSTWACKCFKSSSPMANLPSGTTLARRQISSRILSEKLEDRRVLLRSGRSLQFIRSTFDQNRMCNRQC